MMMVMMEQVWMMNVFEKERCPTNLEVWYLEGLMNSDWLVYFYQKSLHLLLYQEVHNIAIYEYINQIDSTERTRSSICSPPGTLLISLIAASV